ncbi:hypothetical protein KA344_18415, partial [bacterium]|nr:hypothetical protein [bacterium]
RLRSARILLQGKCLIRRTAVCGPARTVVWQGGTREGSPYANWRRIDSSKNTPLTNRCLN